jgi:hypothetical protein
MSKSRKEYITKAFYKNRINIKFSDIVYLDDNVEPTYLCKTELLSLDTSKSDFLPCFSTISLASSIHSTLELLQVNQGNSQLGPV